MNPIKNTDYKIIREETNMMELALIRTMLDKEFYDNHKGIRCPDKIFSKDARKIKQTLDYAMSTYDKNLTPTELQALFFSLLIFSSFEDFSKCFNCSSLNASTLLTPEAIED